MNAVEFNKFITEVENQSSRHSSPLDIEGELFDDTQLKRIFEAVAKNHKIKSLSYHGDHFADGNGKMLAECLQLLPRTALTSFILCNSKIEDNGAAALAKVLPQTKIRIVNLSLNNIGDDGAKALARVLPQTKIRWLSLTHNKIADEGMRAFVNELFPNKNALHQLHLNANNASKRVEDESTEAIKLILLRNSKHYQDKYRRKNKIQADSDLSGLDINGLLDDEVVAAYTDSSDEDDVWSDYVVVEGDTLDEEVSDGSDDDAVVGHALVFSAIAQTTITTSRAPLVVAPASRIAAPQNK